MFNFINQKIMNFDFKCDKSYYRLFNYFLNKRYKKHALLYNIIDKNLISKIDIHFYFKYYKFIIKKLLIILIIFVTLYTSQSKSFKIIN